MKAPGNRSSKNARPALLPAIAVSMLGHETYVQGAIATKKMAKIW
jgi:hypothetical protein